MNASPPVPPSAPAPARHGRRLALVAGLIALTLGVSGLFMGMRQTNRAASGVREALAAGPAAAPVLLYPLAPRYGELHPGRLHPNRDWSVHLTTLVRPDPAAQYTPAVLAPSERARLRATRGARRAYDGAPPVAPHPLDQRSPAACLECHGRPTLVGTIAVPQMSHPFYPSCIQCHVSAVGPSSTWQARNVALSDGNGFVGKEQPGQGARAYAGAPPVIPHTTWMRENCMSCHGPGGTAALRSSHPNRQSCVQCHAPNAALDSRFAAGLPPPLPVAEWKTNLPAAGG